MRILRFSLMAIAMTLLFPCTSSAKAVVAPKGYIYGFVANFTDSVVYFTDIQEVDSVWYDEKSKFLLGRNEYSYQLREYFANKLKMPNRTCVTVFSLTRKEAEKKYLKLKKQYAVKNAGSYDIRYVNENEFHFHAVNMSAAELDKKSEKLQKVKKAKKTKKGKPQKAK